MSIRIALVGSRVFTAEVYDRAIKLLDCLAEIQKEDTSNAIYINTAGFTSLEKDIAKQAENRGIRNSMSGDKYDYTTKSQIKKVRDYSSMVRKVHPKYKRMGKRSFYHMCVIAAIIKNANLVIGVPNNGKGRGSFALRMANYQNKPSIDLTSVDADCRIEKLVGRLGRLRRARENREERLKEKLKRQQGNRTHTNPYVRNMYGYHPTFEDTLEAIAVEEEIAMTEATAMEMEEMEMIEVAANTEPNVHDIPMTRLENMTINHILDAAVVPAGMVELVQLKLEHTSITSPFGVIVGLSMAPHHWRVGTVYSDQSETAKNKAMHHINFIHSTGDIDQTVKEYAEGMINNGDFFIEG